MSQCGSFVISLDFEKMWGIHDMEWERKKDYILKVDAIIPKILEIFKEYNISASWATVGMLFFKSKKEMLDFSKDIKQPTYDNPSLSAYSYFDYLESNDRLHFANDLITKISETPNQEIASHTFSHYYCNEKGQTIEQFEDDLKASIKISKQYNIEPKSLILPRNQYSDKYLSIAKKLGFTAFRGLEQDWIHRLKCKKIKRLISFMSSYIPMSKNECYSINSISKELPYNIKSSFFFRAATKIKLLEFMKMTRVKSLMKKAAKKRLICHIWFHPHNLSNNIDIGLAQIRELCSYYKKLNEQYGFKSSSMNEIAKEIN